MKFTTTTAFTSALLLLTPLTSALPTTTQITLRITNDLSGANAAVTVPADNVQRPLRDLLRGTALDSLVGTSAQLTAFTDTTKCALVNGDWVIELDGRAKNFVDLDGDRTRAVPVWLGGFMFACRQA